MSRRRAFWRGAAAILVAAALVALVAVVRGRLTDTDGRILASLTALLFCGGTALAGLGLLDRDVSPLLGRATVAGAGAALALELYGVWSFVFDGGSETPSKAAWSGTVVAVGLLLASTARLLARTERLVRLAGLASALVAVAVALGVAALWGEPNAGWFVKLVAAAWILAGLSFFLVPVLGRFEQDDEAPSLRVVAALDGIEVVAVRGSGTGGVPIDLRAGERLELRRGASAG